MSNYVFVIDTNKTPCNPIHPAIARKLLNDNKAAIFRRYPFTIILKTISVEPIKPIQQKDSQFVQKIFENVRAYGDITVGDIKQISQFVINSSNILKSTSFPQNIPPSNTEKFIGREGELECLHQQLQRNNEVVTASVEGMGELGKQN